MSTLCFVFDQVVKLIDVFPYGTGFVLVFEYMLSDLSEVLRNSARPLTEVSIYADVIDCIVPENNFIMPKVEEIFLRTLNNLT